MVNIKKQLHCRICQSKDMEEFISLGEQSYTGRFPKKNDKEPPIEEIALLRCNCCGLIQMKYTYPPNEMYGKNYGYRSSITETMRKHLRSISLLSYEWHIKKHLNNVLDIGSNDGTLLNFFNKKANKVVGIDPCAGKHAHNYPSNSILIENFFTKKNLQEKFLEKFDVITSISMFYDLDEPIKFAKDIKSLLEEDGIWICEQSHSHSLIESKAYDSICHEHATYLSLSSFKTICEKVGLKILDIKTNSINGGSFCLVMSHKSSKYKENQNNINEFKDKEEKLKINDKNTWLTFKNKVFNHKIELKECLLNLKKQNKKIFGYGASTKGNVVLQFCDLDKNIIEYMLERDPLKFGCKTPGTNIPIISEDKGRSMKPDILVVFPWHFKDEIIKREKEFLSNGGALLFPLPKIEIITK